jgi:tight adherence protein B
MDDLPIDPETLAVLGAAVFVIIAVLVAAVMAASEHKRRRRIEQIQERVTGAVKEVQTARLRRTETMSALARTLQTLMPNSETLGNRLESAGWSFGVGNYVLLCMGIGIAAAAVLFVLLPQQIPLAVLAGITIGVGAPHVVLGFLARRYVERATALLPDAIDLMVRGLRSGLPVQETINTVATEIGPPLGPLFNQIQHEVAFGVSIEDAFWKVAKQANIHELNFLIIAMSIQRETGGNLAETLANLSGLLRSRRQLKLKIRAFTSEARATAVIISALPFLVFAALAYINPGYIFQLFSDVRGQMMVLGAGCSMATGIFIMMKMANFKV